MSASKISATIITLNEERNIGRCLDSLQNVADEIVVLDSGSTDKTEQICLAYKRVKFIKSKWLGFGKQKQRAVELATYPWILSLDADECLSADLQTEILALKPQLHPAQAFELKRKTNYCGQWILHCGWYPDPQLRLFHREHGRWLDVPVHEHVVCEANIKINRSRAELLHYSYGSIEEHREKLVRYAELGASKLRHKNGLLLRLQSYTNAASRFCKIYFLKLGFLDGHAGWVIAWMAAYAAHLKYNLAVQNRNVPNNSID